ncbi:MAG: hypothetical protein LBL66_01125, partial [Clostridiales bacterium]|nr:hypothetical protein [Clostridiales bacterium]
MKEMKVETVRLHSSGAARGKTAAARKKTAAKAALYAAMAAVGIFLIFPYAFMASRSFMSVGDIRAYPVKFFPAEPTFDAYVKMFAQNNYLRYTLNTLTILAFNVAVMPLSASLCAYGFAKIKYPGSGLVFALVLATTMIPGTVVQIPLYVMFSNLGWLETALPLTIPNLFGGG